MRAANKRIEPITGSAVRQPLPFRAFDSLLVTAHPRRYAEAV